MGAFKIEILGVGGHGCDRSAKPGEKLYGRCGKFTCPDCAAYEFTQTLRQRGMLRDGDTALGQEIHHSPSCPVIPECTCSAVPDGAGVYYTDSERRIVPQPVPNGKQFWLIPHRAEFTHWPLSPDSVVDDMMTNTRKRGSF